MIGWMAYGALRRGDRQRRAHSQRLAAQAERQRRRAPESGEAVTADYARGLSNGVAGTIFAIGWLAFTIWIFTVTVPLAGIGWIVGSVLAVVFR